MVRARTAGAAGGGRVLTVLFVVVERRAAEPIIPLRLFQNPVFAVANIYGFLAGVAMFGVIIFLPFYLQAVMGMSPTESGLALLPVMVGILITSIGSGRLITRTGRYKIFPILGAAILICVASDVPVAGRYTVLATRAL